MSVLDLPSHCADTVNFSFDSFVESLSKRSGDRCVLCLLLLKSIPIEDHFKKVHWPSKILLGDYYMVHCMCGKTRQTLCGKKAHYHCPYCDQCTIFHSSEQLASHTVNKHNILPCKINISHQSFCKHIEESGTLNVQSFPSYKCICTNTRNELEHAKQDSQFSASVKRAIPPPKDNLRKFRSLDSNLTSAKSAKRRKIDTDVTASEVIVSTITIDAKSSAQENSEQEPIQDVTTLSDYERRLLELYKSRQKGSIMKESNTSTSNTESDRAEEESVDDPPSCEADITIKSEESATIDPNVSSLVYMNGKKTSVGFISKKYTEIANNKMIDNFIAKNQSPDKKLKNIPSVPVEDIRSSDVQPQNLCEVKTESDTGIKIESEDETTFEASPLDMISDVKPQVSTGHQSTFRLKPINSLLDPKVSLVPTTAVTSNVVEKALIPSDSSRFAKRCIGPRSKTMVYLPKDTEVISSSDNKNDANDSPSQSKKRKYGLKLKIPDVVLKLADLQLLTMKSTKENSCKIRLKHSIVKVTLCKSYDVDDDVRNHVFRFDNSYIDGKCVVGDPPSDEICTYFLMSIDKGAKEKDLAASKSGSIHLSWVDARLDDIEDAFCRPGPEVTMKKLLPFKSVKGAAEFAERNGIDLGSVCRARLFTLQISMKPAPELYIEEPVIGISCEDLDVRENPPLRLKALEPGCIVPVSPALHAEANDHCKANLQIRSNAIEVVDIDDADDDDDDDVKNSNKLKTHNCTNAAEVLTVMNCDDGNDQSVCAKFCCLDETTFKLPLKDQTAEDAFKRQNTIMRMANAHENSAEPLQTNENVSVKPTTFRPSIASSLAGLENEILQASYGESSKQKTRLQKIVAKAEKLGKKHTKLCTFQGSKSSKKHLHFKGSMRFSSYKCRQFFIKSVDNVSEKITESTATVPHCLYSEEVDSSKCECISVSNEHTSSNSLLQSVVDEKGNVIPERVVSTYFRKGPQNTFQYFSFSDFSDDEERPVSVEPQSLETGLRLSDERIAKTIAKSTRLKDPLNDYSQLVPVAEEVKCSNTECNVGKEGSESNCTELQVSQNSELTCKEDVEDKSVLEEPVIVSEEFTRERLQLVSKRLHVDVKLLNRRTIFTQLRSRVVVKLKRMSNSDEWLIRLLRQEKISVKSYAALMVHVSKLPCVKVREEVKANRGVLRNFALELLAAFERRQKEFFALYLCGLPQPESENVDRNTVLNWQKALSTIDHTQLYLDLWVLQARLELSLLRNIRDTICQIKSAITVAKLQALQFNTTPIIGSEYDKLNELVLLEDKLVKGLRMKKSPLQHLNKFDTVRPHERNSYLDLTFNPYYYKSPITLEDLLDLIGISCNADAFFPHSLLESTSNLSYGDHVYRRMELDLRYNLVNLSQCGEFIHLVASSQQDEPHGDANLSCKPFTLGFSQECLSFAYLRAVFPKDKLPCLNTSTSATIDANKRKFSIMSNRRYDRNQKRFKKISHEVDVNTDADNCDKDDAQRSQASFSSDSDDSADNLFIDQNLQTTVDAFRSSRDGEDSNTRNVPYYLGPKSVFPLTHEQETACLMTAVNSINTNTVTNVHFCPNPQTALLPWANNSTGKFVLSPTLNLPGAVLLPRSSVPPIPPLGGVLDPINNASVSSQYQPFFLLASTSFDPKSVTLDVSGEAVANSTASDCSSFGGFPAAPNKIASPVTTIVLPATACTPITTSIHRPTCLSPNSVLSTPKTICATQIDNIAHPATQHSNTRRCTARKSSSAKPHAEVKMNVAMTVSPVRRSYKSPPHRKTVNVSSSSSSEDDDVVLCSEDDSFHLCDTFTTFAAVPKRAIADNHYVRDACKAFCSQSPSKKLKNNELANCSSVDGIDAPSVALNRGLRKPITVDLSDDELILLDSEQSNIKGQRNGYADDNDDILTDSDDIIIDEYV